ncbi:hypothetical protein DPMN_085727 [Dreissena polymorpha]|uniref:Uncharacterized protein n=1 Tax=Dreissena polymorpha TaxID=45954 RepID=A0A9D3YD76_DREPO|nr:hypothetical protein DPMN_085727 [Dreissena polymorpha]
MARQVPTRARHVEIDRNVIREVQYQLEVNRSRNEQIIVKDNFGWGPYIVEIVLIVIREANEINCIVIREVQYQFEVNWCRNEEIIVKGNFGWAWPMSAGRPRFDRIVIREYKGNFGWAWPMWAGALGLVMGPCIAEIDRIVIREVKYQFEVNRCRNEEIIVKGNFGWAWPMWAGRPRVGNGAMHKAQCQFEVNRCRNKEVNFQGSSANSVGGAVAQDGRTDGQTHINTISPLFLRKTWG